MAERQRTFFDKRSTRQRYLEIVDIAFLADQKLGKKRRTKPATMKSFLRVIECHARDNPTCRIKKKTIAEEMNVKTIQTVNRASKDLEDCGLLYVERSCSPKDDSATVYGIDWKALMEAVTDNPTTFKKVERWIATTGDRRAKTEIPENSNVTSDKPTETHDISTETGDIPIETGDISTSESVTPTSYSRERVNHHENHLRNIPNPHDHERSKICPAVKSDQPNPLIDISRDRLGRADTIHELYLAAVDQKRVVHSEQSMQSFFRLAFHCHHSNSAKVPGALFMSLLEKEDYQGASRMDDLAHNAIKSLLSATGGAGWGANKTSSAYSRGNAAVDSASHSTVTSTPSDSLSAIGPTPFSHVISQEIGQRFEVLRAKLKSRNLSEDTIDSIALKLGLRFDVDLPAAFQKYRDFKVAHIERASIETKRYFCEVFEMAIASKQDAVARSP